MDKGENAYRVGPGNVVTDWEGVVVYNEGDKATAEQIAAFLNNRHKFEKALEEVLDAHDYPLSGEEWQEIQKRCAIKGET